MAETKQKPTPGPFQVNVDWNGAEVRGPSGVAVAWFGTSSVSGPDGSYQIKKAEAAANARMFVAAGDLLEALRVAVDSGLGDKWVWSDTAREQWFRNARAAIYRAEGAQ